MGRQEWQGYKTYKLGWKSDWTTVGMESNHLTISHVGSALLEENKQTNHRNQFTNSK